MIKVVPDVTIRVRPDSESSEIHLPDRDNFVGRKVAVENHSPKILLVRNCWSNTTFHQYALTAFLYHWDGGQWVLVPPTSDSYTE